MMLDLLIVFMPNLFCEKNVQYSVIINVLKFVLFTNIFNILLNHVKPMYRFG